MNTPLSGSGARSDGYLIREERRSPRVSRASRRLQGARAAVRAIAEAQGDLAMSLQERISAQPRSAKVLASRNSVPTRCSASSVGASSPACRAVLHDRGAWTPPTEADEPLHRPGREPSYSKPSGPEHGRSVKSRRGHLYVFGPLGNEFRLDVERPLLVGGGIGIAPLRTWPRRSAIRPNAARLSQRTARRSRCPTAERRCRRQGLHASPSR